MKKDKFKSENILLIWGVCSDYVLLVALVGDQRKTFYLEFADALRAVPGWSEAVIKYSEFGLMVEMDFGPDRRVADVLFTLEWRYKEATIAWAVANLEPVEVDGFKVVEFDGRKNMVA